MRTQQGGSKTRPTSPRLPLCLRAEATPETFQRLLCTLGISNSARGKLPRFSNEPRIDFTPPLTKSRRMSPIPPPLQTQMHVVDYQIHGSEMQFVEIELDPGEAVVAEAGAMMFMEEGIAMEAIFGD